MAALEHKIQGGRRQIAFNEISGFRFIDREQLLEALRVGGLKVEMALSFLKRKPDIAITAVGIPAQIPDAFDVLQIHRQTLKPIGDLNRHRLAIDAAALLEIGELGHLHAIEPHLPAHAPGAEGR